MHFYTSHFKSLFLSQNNGNDRKSQPPARVGSSVCIVLYLYHDQSKCEAMSCFDYFAVVVAGTMTADWQVADLFLTQSPEH